MGYLKGIHVITEVATKYKAYDFFDEKIKIANDMRSQMSEYFSQHLYSHITSLQINEDSLPGAFAQAVENGQTMKNNISQMQNTKNKSQVQFQTDVMVAKKQRDATITRAGGQAKAILENANANANIVKAYTEAEIDAYALIKTKTGMDGDHLLDYIWYDILGSGGVGSEAAGTTLSSA